jgi:hypothetical protein
MPGIEITKPRGAATELKLSPGAVATWTIVARDGTGTDQAVSRITWKKEGGIALGVSLAGSVFTLSAPADGAHGSATISATVWTHGYPGVNDSVSCNVIVTRASDEGVWGELAGSPQVSLPAVR